MTRQALATQWTLTTLVEALQSSVDTDRALEPMAVPELETVSDLAPWPPPVPPTSKGASGGTSMVFTVWALVPALTFGWGTPFTFTYAAVRMRSAFLGWCTAAYAVVASTSFLLLSGSASDDSWQVDVGTMLTLLVMAVATAHAFALRPRLMESPTPDQLAVASAKKRLQLRERARHLAGGNPSLADGLRIGRPDLPCGFDDGGLVDVNHVPVSVLAAVQGISNEVAEEIALLREAVGGFDSLNDLSVTLGLAPQSLDGAAEYLIFRRPSAPR
jgi:hypothetical protein